MTGILEGLAISAAASALGAGITYALTPTQKIEQGRVNSLLPGTVGYGQPIPWAWGTVRLPGRRIWQTFLEEKKKKTKQGKGAKVETTDYSYYGYYAELFCECPFRPIVDFKRVWMNKKLVYSTTGGAETIAAGSKFADRYLRFYYGNSAQETDPLLENAEPIQGYSYGLPNDPNERAAYLRSLGISHAVFTPAYNYHTYMVAQRLPLSDFFNAIPGGEAEICASDNCTVGQIIGDIMSLFFERDRYDVSLLTMPVHGFSIDSPKSAKSVIQTLQQAFFFDVVNSGSIIKFIPLNHPRNVINLSSSDLAAHSGGKEKPLDYEVIETDPNALPSKVIVKYIDPDNDYDIGEQYSNGEVRQHYNNQPVRLDFNLVMTGSSAATLADRAFYLAWSRKFLYKFQLPPAYLDLEPSDLIPDLFSGGDIPIKLTQIRIGANLILDCEGHQHDNFFFNFVRLLESGGVTTGVADYNVVLEVDGTVNTVADTSGQIYSQGTDYNINPEGNIQILSGGSILEGTDLVVSTAAPPTGTTQEIKVHGDTTLLILDIPLIDNSDPDYTLYLVASGDANWNGATIYYSIDNSRYIEVTTINTYGIHGTTVDVLDATDRLTVTVNEQELETITQSDLALGFNYALVGDEIIQFKTAELIDYNTYQLSDIRRGLRGTEHEIDNHFIGDRFVLLTGENAALTKITATFDDIGETRYFKAVSGGQVLDEVEPSRIDYRAISMRPYAPINIAATKNAFGDITITWDRRDRHDQKQNPQLSERSTRASGETPDGETSTIEEYRVEVINTSNNQSVRSQEVNSNSSIYTAAEQSIDFGTVQTTITVKVAQVSSVYGIGSYSPNIELTPTQVEPLPVITATQPKAADWGDRVTIIGDNLASLREVLIGSQVQELISVTNNQTVHFTVASYSQSDNLTVVTESGSATSKQVFLINNSISRHTLIQTSRQIIVADHSKIISCESSEKITLYLDANLVFPGFETTIRKKGSGDVTLVVSEGQTLEATGNTITARYTAIYLTYRGNNLWIGVGSFG